MRILEVNKYLYLRRGAEKHVLDLAELLQNNGHEVRLFGMKHPENKFQTMEGDLPSYVGYNKGDSSFWERAVGIGRIFWSFEVGKKFRKVLRDWQPQVIHIHNIYHQLSFSLLSVARKTGIPVVMTVHDYAAISPDKDAYYPEVGKSYWKFMRIQKYSFSKRLLLTLRAYWEEFLGGYNAFVDIFIVPSKLVEQALVATGIPQSKIVLLPHFTTVAKNRSTKEELPTNLPEKFILALTGASAVKNTPWLEETCITLGIPLVIAGTVEDSYQPSTSPCIFYVGQKSQEELNNYWQRAVAGVSASLLPETFGLVALEALSLGKSFFCFDAGAYKEVVRTGVDGVVAQSEEEFTAGLQKMWNQETVYDLVAIQKSAEERFGAAGYLEKFLKILKTLPHK